jgi:hypothetical protein
VSNKAPLINPCSIDNGRVRKNRDKFTEWAAANKRDVIIYTNIYKIAQSIKKPNTWYICITTEVGSI